MSQITDDGIRLVLQTLDMNVTLGSKADFHIVEITYFDRLPG
jgi:hypothetical protein